MAEASGNLLSVQLADRTGEDQIECFIVGQGQAVTVDPQENDRGQQPSRLLRGNQNEGAKRDAGEHVQCGRRHSHAAIADRAAEH